MAIIGVIASSTRQGQAVDLGAMFPLQVITVGAAVSSVTFTNIPSIYAHLQLRALGRTSAAYDSDAINIRFNSDAGNNYAVHFLNGDAVNVSSTNNLTQSSIYVASRMPGATVTANSFGAGIIDILDYANTNKLKTVRTFSGFEPNTSAAVVRIAASSGLWASTSAITTLTVVANSGLLQPNSQFALYGIKSA